MSSNVAASSSSLPSASLVNRVVADDVAYMATVAHVVDSEHASQHEDGTKSNSKLDEWEDITELLVSAAAELDVGEMIHPESFSLYSAMSAIELMQPKMDVGCGPVRNVNDVVLPTTLSDAEVVRIMDELLACQATWLNAHTLPQTVFSCVYTQRLRDVPRMELAAFIRILLATMSVVRSIVTTELVYDEEDFISYDFGFALPSLTESTVNKLVRDAMAEIRSKTEDTPTRNALVARLWFLQALHSALSNLGTLRSRGVNNTELLIEVAANHLKAISETWSMFPDDVIASVFDATFNRHMLSNTPPRTAPILSRAEACTSYLSLIDQLRALVFVKDTIMPPGREGHIPAQSSEVSKPDTSKASTPSHKPRYSFHNLLHGLTCFSAKWNPSVVTRSLLKRMVAPSGSRESPAVLSIEGATITSMLLADMGLTPISASPVLREQASALSPYAEHLVLSLCRNRGRQRRCLLKSLKAWDQAVHITTRTPMIPPPAPSSLSGGLVPLRSSAEQVPDKAAEKAGPHDMFAGVSPMQLIAHEVSVRAMMQHWLLGFECDLYMKSEYAPVFFYLGYVITTSANATAALADLGLEGAELHPGRYALYLLDEGRMWLCRAMFSLLEALEAGDQWRYSWRRRPHAHIDDDGMDDEAKTTAGLLSERLWYDQRFGMMSKLCTGPQFMGHGTFLSLMKLQGDMLAKRDSKVHDKIYLRLSDANDGFKTARQAFERAAQTATAHGWKYTVASDAISMKRVAVSNQILIAQLIKMHAQALTAPSASHVASSNVNFSFKDHRHFPVVTISARPNQ
jgi:Mak10 subunit, NatC N(alpha)-terminal acetyltransferase